MQQTNFDYKYFRKSLHHQFNMNLMHFDYNYRNTDVLIASYPRSGNTWVRSVLSYILAEINNDAIKNSLGRLSKYTPSLYKVEMTDDPGPRYIKTHSHYIPIYNNLKKNIYIYRDGRDVAVSYYHYKLMNQKNYSKISFSDFLRNIFFGQLDVFAPWHENIRSWVSNSLLNNNVLFVKYEDLLNTPDTIFSKIVKYLDIQYSSKLIDEAIDACSIEKLQKQEQFDNSDFTKHINTHKVNKKHSFFRNGKSGSYKEYFSHKDLLLFDMYCGDIMRFLGYNCSDSGPAKLINAQVD